ncbi:hypothetical protein DFA_09725 [Cavenderia fasciculata]|uniref:IPT/TIG domain-containing protein n=1 Tax=Cavenderia fasciculata TaxID=261658 RepID=F4Q8F3_CACFS|nr:uncharacterized protein DFA_09725 [Cavenderia fasciculata]EGG16053.1 hypothetical protein DFA_09725 [Cavenderia fasciculata]|eukprot:XP_004352378.1 hypothetical protein DFA_09725 [Cavenderia fasciculata]
MDKTELVTYLFLLFLFSFCIINAEDASLDIEIIGNQPLYFTKNGGQILKLKANNLKDCSKETPYIKIKLLGARSSRLVTAKFKSLDGLEGSFQIPDIQSFSYGASDEGRWKAEFKLLCPRKLNEIDYVLSYWYTEPYIQHIFPGQGFFFGGYMVTITGRYLKVGNPNIQIRIGSLKCALNPTYTDGIITCTIEDRSRDKLFIQNMDEFWSSDADIKVSVEIKFDGINLSNLPFTFQIPTVIDMNPQSPQLLNFNGPILFGLNVALKESDNIIIKIGQSKCDVKFESTQTASFIECTKFEPPSDKTNSEIEITCNNVQVKFHHSISTKKQFKYLCMYIF